MTLEQANKQFPNYKWVLAKLPDSYIDCVTEVEDGIFLSAEDGASYDTEELEFIDDEWIKFHMKSLLKIFSYEKLAEILNLVKS